MMARAHADGVARNDESGIAMVAVVAMLIVTMLIIVALSVITRASSDQNADQKTVAIGEAAAYEGVNVYVKSLNSNKTGEQLGFRFTGNEIKSFVLDNGGGACGPTGPNLCYMSDDATPYPATGGSPKVDTTYIPAADRLTVRRFLGNNTYSFWQAVAIVPPLYGVKSGANPLSPGGRIVAYVRGWVGSATGVSLNRSTIVRTSLRPGSFSDFEIMTDGQFMAGAGININGRIHSNGFSNSYNNAYAGVPWRINLSANNAPCTSSAQVSTGTGTILPSASCAPYVHEGTGELVSLMRGSDTVDWVLTQCGNPTLSVPVHCPGFAPKTGTGYYNVSLSGTTVTVSGATSTVSYSAANTRTTYGTTGLMGTVVVLPGPVRLSGTLGGAARATIVATSRGTRSKYSDTPSIRIETSGKVGSAGLSSRTAVGLIADGDIVAVQGKACPVTVNAAMIALGGALSSDPDYRDRTGLIDAGVPGTDAYCGSDFTEHGSVSGHYTPIMIPAPGQGYAERNYDYDPFLYDNSPPLFPRFTQWEEQEHVTADLSCFNPATGKLIVTVPGCR